ncbi:MAG: phage holin family protein [Cyclobacteriaceae bacterium]|nr:phage holin family protein [Cyclobacteriaceae bacterium]
MIKETLLRFFKLDGFINHLSEYVETRIELLKYELKEDIARAMAKIAIAALIVLFLTLFIIFISVAVAYVLAESVGTYGGFGIVGGVYFLLMLLIIIFRDNISAKLESEIKKSFKHKHQNHEGDGNG